MDKKYIQLKNITKRYNEGLENEIEVLSNIELEVEKGEFISIVGESGSGKSTLMNILGTLDRPTSGKYYVENKDITEFTEKEISVFRNQVIGFIFQSFYLLPQMDALHNVMLPMVYGSIPRKQRSEKAKQMLELVGMENRMFHKPSKLSGGQNQRVAIARALINEPDIILADEPTGALDKKNTKIVMDTLRKLNEEFGITIIMITHSHEMAELANRKIIITDGKLYDI